MTSYEILDKSNGLRECLHILTHGTAQEFFDSLEEYNFPINFRYRRCEKGHITTFFHEAVLHDNIELVKLFIEKGADVNILDGSKETPLSFSSWYNNIEISKLLLDKGADVNHKNNRGRTHLFHPIISYGSEEVSDVEEIFNLLVNHGLNINEQDNQGNTVLIWSLKGEKYDISFFLLEKGVNPYITNNKEQTFLDVIKPKKRRKEFEKWLEENYHCGGVKPAK